MEKAWIEFTKTGRVTDYLKYRGLGSKIELEQENRLLKCEIAMEWSDKKEQEE